MLHLDQHSALPPESIMGCDNIPHFFYIMADDAAAADSGDYDELDCSKVEGELFFKFDVYSIFD